MERFEKEQGHVYSYQQVKEMHTRFLDELEAKSEAQKDFGVISQKGDKLSVACLGKTFPIECRPVAPNGEISLMEYRIQIAHGRDTLTVWRAYLDHRGSLWADAKCEKRLFDFNNSYIYKKFTAHILNSLVESPEFEPTPSLDVVA